MKMLRLCIAAAASSLALLASPAAHTAWADPTLSVSPHGAANGNQLWLVEVAPDPSLFTTTPEGLGGSLAVELDFRIDGSEVVSVTKNAADWPYDNPAFNPFIDATSLGVTMGTDTAFISLGSNVFTTGDAVEVATIETLGAGVGMLSWGGNVAVPDVGDPYNTARIAQAGMRFDGLTGATSVAAGQPGDYNGNGRVEQADLDLVLLNWGQGGVPGGWTNDLPTGNIDQAELDGVLLNWGEGAALGSAAAVPEPATCLLALLGGVIAAACTSRRGALRSIERERP